MCSEGYGTWLVCLCVSSRFLHYNKAQQDRQKSTPTSLALICLILKLPIFVTSVLFIASYLPVCLDCQMRGFGYNNTLLFWYIRGWLK